MKTLLGYVSAYIPKTPTMKAQYNKVGVAFTDDDGRISIKLDSIPIAGGGWAGWLNIFPPNEKDSRPKAKDGGPPFEGDDDIPF
jgi:hypothetical protein